MCACARARVYLHACCGCASYMRWVTDSRTHLHERWYSHLLLIITAHCCSRCQLAHRSSCQTVLHVRQPGSCDCKSVPRVCGAEPRRPSSARQIHEPDHWQYCGVESMGLQYQPCEGVLVVVGRRQGTKVTSSRLTPWGPVPVTSVLSIRLSSLEPLAGECTERSLGAPPQSVPWDGPGSLAEYC
jgi:hypothetical protein